MRLRRFVSFSPLTAVAAAVAVTIALSLGATPAQANINVPIDADQASESANPGASGTGKGIISYDIKTKTLFWNITFSGMQGDFSSAHFHGPAVKGVGAAIQVTITGTESPLIGSAVIDQTKEDDLLADLYYINIHSTHSPLGEIRGQVRGVVSVGGVAELVDVDAAALEAAGSSGGNTTSVVAITVLIAVAVIGLGGGAWFVGRRALR